MQAHLATALEPDHPAFRVVVGAAGGQGLVGEIGDQLVETRAAQRTQDVWAIEDIDPVDAAEVDEHLAIGVAEDKPRIAFVRDAAIGLDRYIRAAEQLADPEEIRKFLVAPILLGVWK